VSLAEHYARIMVDEAVAAAVPQHLWQESVNRLAAAMRDDRVADGYVDAVEACATLLERSLPPRATDEDELANRIVLI
jgi:putative membrane protein